jgi:Flp pilus assembly protein TadD
VKTFPITALVLLVCVTADAQTPSRAAQGKRRPTAQRKTPAIPTELTKAEEAINKKDYASAEPLLLTVTKNNPQDFRAWYDLGFVYAQTNRPEEAITAFKKSIAIDASIEQTQAALGALLLQLNRDDEAIPYLAKAAALKPSAQAWLSLGAAQEKAHPQEAVVSFRKAADADPANAEPHVRAGVIYEQLKDWPNAEREYIAARKLKSSPDALAGLVNVYQQTGRTDQAESALREYLKISPKDPKAHLQLGRILAQKGAKDEASKEFEAATADAKDPNSLKRLASEFATNKDYPKAISTYRRLLQDSPQDVDARFQLAVALNSSGEFAGAEQEFINVIKLAPKMPEAYGNLAVAASKNNHHELAIRALDTRAKFAPETAGTYFLRATSYDHLKQFPLAAENYHLFLQTANGAYPDQEWQARHRLIAIEPDGGKKKK